MRIALLVLLLIPAQQRKLEWKLAPGRVARYAFLEKNGKPSKDRDLVVFGSELTPTGNRIFADRYDELPLPLLLQLPPEPFKGGAAWEYNGAFFQDGSDVSGFLEAAVGFGGFKPVAVKGRYVLKSIQKKGDDEIATIDGAFSFFEIRRDFVNNQTKFVVTKNDLGTLATSAQISVSRGLLVRGGWQLRVKGQERVVERGAARVADKAFNVHEMIELLEEKPVEADPAAALKKGVDFLRGRAGSGPDQALLLHALLAAGATADDPVIAAALKTLRAAPTPPETAALARAVWALALGGAADDAKRLAAELVARRDVRTGVWSAGGRNDGPNPVITATAVAALAAVDGAKVPDDAWTSALEAFLSSWIEEGPEVDLAVDFAENATTIAADPKKVVPATWPADAGRRGGGNNPLQMGARKGSGFVVLAALETCLVASSKLKLEERQRQSLDTALRKGLAWVQSRWTLRGVPPSEGAWSLQRLEYLGRLGAVLARSKVEVVAGSDWRLEGTSMLLRGQGDDGAWASGTEQAVAKTAHALLFLAAAKR
ncbi:MAG TPA: hypothetical protein VF950_18130 [Planctomycetota bacterium]